MYVKNLYYSLELRYFLVVNRAKINHQKTVPNFNEL